MSVVDDGKPGWLASREELATQWWEAMNQAVESLVDTERLRSFVVGAVAMPGRSIGNTALVLSQYEQLRGAGLVSAPQPTACLGYHEWAARGRHIQKGQEGMKILRPVTGRLVPSGEVDANGKAMLRVLRASEQPLEGVVPQVRVFGFQASTVFDVSQTEGTPIPVRDKPVVAPELLRDALGVEAEKLGYTVRFDADQEMNDRMISASLRALTLPGENLVLVRGGETTAQVEALTHELGHITMGHAGQHSARRGVKEVEAEVVGGMLNTAYGLNPWPTQEGYESDWAGQKNIAQTVGKTLDTARRKACEHSIGIAQTLGVADSLAPVEIPMVEQQTQNETIPAPSPVSEKTAPHEPNPVQQVVSQAVKVPPPPVRVDQVGM